MTGESTVGHLDPTDREIIGELAENARVSWQELGRRINLSANATAERVKRLERLGVIEGYTARYDFQALGRPIDAFIAVKMHPGDDREEFEKLVRSEDSILEAVHLTGPHDYFVRARCRSTEELDDLLMGMKASAGVADTETRIVLRRLRIEAADRVDGVEPRRRASPSGRRGRFTG
jgi:Lrp/AsnC family leucine-responsive transcriptional regulator